MILLDIDSTLFDTFGSQEDGGFNYHYSNHRYHPLLCYDGSTGHLLKVMLEPGTVYNSTECCAFLKPLLTEYLEDYTDVSLYLGGDSCFACPDLFELLETKATFHSSRLKVNDSLSKLAESKKKMRLLLII